jgi:uncharacterized hydrophobic protein (TIGR00341 family)
MTNGDSIAVARILVSTSNTETITDALSQRFTHLDEFRLMLFTVEATLPLPEESAEEQAEEQASDEQTEQDTENDQAAWPRVSREELYQTVSQGAQLSHVYLVTVVLSTVVAAVGLLRGNVAIIIGAMVIAPLLGPNIALALASTLGDLKLVWRSVKTLLAGVAVASLLSLGIGFVVAVDPQSPEIAARTQVHLGDILLALAAGSAGALAITTGISTAVIGVMVAVALLPPLVVVGLLLGAGHTMLAIQALILLVSNIACINLAGVVTFLWQKIRPREWWEAEAAERATRMAIALWIVTVGLLLALILLTGPVGS